jgi:alpha-glucosidase
MSARVTDRRYDGGMVRPTGFMAALAFASIALPSCSSSPAAPPARTPPPTRPTPAQEARARELLTGPDWYRHAVFYEVYVRSFADSNGDGIGDLAGLTAKLDYLKGLGVDALWLMPIMPTPFADSGYDVADYRGINPDYGDMAAFDALLAAAHARGMRVIVDLVLNHTSDRHPWFIESRSSRTNPKADWYVWSDTPSRADIGCGPASAQFGTDPWTFDPTRGQYYYHRFYPGQPDLNYANPEVVAETLDIARFWLDKGVDGFRCDVIGMLVETSTECELAPGTVDYIKKLRAVLDAYPDRAMVAESGLGSPAGYFGGGADMFHMAFDFSYGYFWAVGYVGQNNTIAKSALEAASTTFPTGAQAANLIGSHDVARSWSRALGVEWRYRRAAEISMFMRGTPFIYYGEELALRPGTGVVVDTRDSARTPMPWTRAPGHGFTTGKPWLDFGADVDATNVEVEDADPNSMLTFYRQLLTFRRGHAVWGTGEQIVLPVDNGALLAFVRRNAEEAYLVVESFSEDAQEGSAPAAGVGSVGELVWGDGRAAIEGGALKVKLPGSAGAVFRLQ